MYVANFICDDRNGDDGIYGTECNDIGAHRFTSVADALAAIADDADSHAAMYADTAERHWHGAFSAAAAYFHTVIDPLVAVNFATSNGGGYRYYVNGSDDGDGEPWTLGYYSVTLDTATII
jgi:hypothetical protein